MSAIFPSSTIFLWMKRTPYFLQARAVWALSSWLPCTRKTFLCSLEISRSLAPISLPKRVKSPAHTTNSGFSFRIFFFSSAGNLPWVSTKARKLGLGIVVFKHDFIQFFQLPDYIELSIPDRDKLLRERARFLVERDADERNRHPRIPQFRHFIQSFFLGILAHSRHRVRKQKQMFARLALWEQLQAPPQHGREIRLPRCAYCRDPSQEFMKIVRRLDLLLDIRAKHNEPNFVFPFNRLKAERDSCFLAHVNLPSLHASGSVQGIDEVHSSPALALRRDEIRSLDFPVAPPDRHLEGSFDVQILVPVSFFVRPV